MDQEVLTCLVCFTELQEETEIVTLNTSYDGQLTYGDCIRFCLGSFGQILEQNINGAVCNDCSIELEISYKFLKKLMVSRDVLSQAYESENAQTETYGQESVPKDENEELTKVEYATESLGETNDWNTEVINEQQDANSDEQKIIKFIITETDAEIENQIHDETEVKSDADQQSAVDSNDDDLIEEIPYEEVEVYTNISDIEKAPTEHLPELVVDGRKHICDYCGKVFPNHSRMSAHRKCHEKTRTTFNCFECGRMYASDQALTVHVRSAHNKEGFTCPYCAKVFFNERSLEIHTRYHTKTFTYDCKDCGKNFAQKGHLNTHQNVRHNGLRFICVFPNCNKLFTSSAALRDHEFSHKTKPFECQYCQGGYASKSKLKQHIRQVHHLDLTLEELEPMRQFHVMRSKPNYVVGVTENV